MLPRCEVMAAAFARRSAEFRVLTADGCLMSVSLSELSDALGLSGFG